LAGNAVTTRINSSRKVEATTKIRPESVSPTWARSLKNVLPLLEINEANLNDTFGSVQR
jgi:hypothetical protein